MTDGTPPHTRSRRHRLTLTLAVAVMAGLIAVIGVITSSALTSGGHSAAPHTDRGGPPPPAADAPQPPVLQPAGQPPGTIWLPQGGTAALVRKELDRSGTLPIPDGVGQATWWGVGLNAPHGATVLAGHVNWKGSVGPFAELWQAAPDQPVIVTDNSGRPWRFRITKVVTVHKDELPQQASDLFGQGGEHRVVLVTCGGRFVGGDAGYNDNRIVVATPAA